MLERILAAASPDMVLVGGQALDFWATYYGVETRAATLTRDADFLGSRADVLRIAESIEGRAAFPHARSLTSLVEQVHKELPGGGHVGIDVLHKVYGNTSSEAIRMRAVTAEPLGWPVKVLHPMDVLQGRLSNVYGLKEKQDEHGIAQLELAITMVRAFLVDQAGGMGITRGATTVRKHLVRIEEMAMSDAGRKVAKRFEQYVADAIEPSVMASHPPFLERRLPQLLLLMSPARRDEIARKLRG
jgi:hypothetical protein